ncbi:MAG: hypothetical protein H7A52_00325 [Akkermansiaceae bacterium]|nr:hypothetical protein [Akkermansiaceae bacterium]
MISVACPVCGHSMNLRRQHLGVRGQCVGCGEPIIAVERPGVGVVIERPVSSPPPAPMAESPRPAAPETLPPKPALPAFPSQVPPGDSRNMAYTSPLPSSAAALAAAAAAVEIDASPSFPPKKNAGPAANPEPAPSPAGSSLFGEPAPAAKPSSQPPAFGPGPGFQSPPAQAPQASEPPRPESPPEPKPAPAEVVAEKPAEPAATPAPAPPKTAQSLFADSFASLFEKEGVSLGKDAPPSPDSTAQPAAAAAAATLPTAPASAPAPPALNPPAAPAPPPQDSQTPPPFATDAPNLFGSDAPPWESELKVDPAAPVANEFPGNLDPAAPPPPDSFENLFATQVSPTVAAEAAPAAAPVEAAPSPKSKTKKSRKKGADKHAGVESVFQGSSSAKASRFASSGVPRLVYRLVVTGLVVAIAGGGAYLLTPPQKVAEWKVQLMEWLRPGVVLREYLPFKVGFLEELARQEEDRLKALDPKNSPEFNPAKPKTAPKPAPPKESGSTPPPPAMPEASKTPEPKKEADTPPEPKPSVAETTPAPKPKPEAKPASTPAASPEPVILASQPQSTLDAPVFGSPEVAAASGIAPGVAPASAPITPMSAAGPPAKGAAGASDPAPSEAPPHLEEIGEEVLTAFYGGKSLEERLQYLIDPVMSRSAVEAYYRRFRYLPTLRSVEYRGPMYDGASGRWFAVFDARENENEEVHRWCIVQIRTGDQKIDWGLYQQLIDEPLERFLADPASPPKEFRVLVRRGEEIQGSDNPWKAPGVEVFLQAPLDSSKSRRIVLRMEDLNRLGLSSELVGNHARIARLEMGWTDSETDQTRRVPTVLNLKGWGAW